MPVSITDDASHSVQLAVRMSQVVTATPGAFGVPVIGVVMSVAVSAALQALRGGATMAVLV